MDEARLRRWLVRLRRPDQLADEAMSHLLRAFGRHPDTASPTAVGQAGAALLMEAIARLKRDEGAPWDRQLPFVILTKCFVERSKAWQAAGDLGMSERQLSRERDRKSVV